MLDRVTVIAFDLDDTLWPCMPTLHRAENILYDWLRQNYPRITQTYDQNQMVDARREFSRRDSRYAIDMTAMRCEFLHHIGELHDYDGSEVSQVGFDIFFEARQQVEFYADVLPCLERLGQKYRLGTITNGNASVEHVGLGHLIEHAVSAEDVQAAKPDPQIYARLAECFDVVPEEIGYVGDHPSYDVVGAVEAGYHAVWINREQVEWPPELPEPRHRVSDLHELEALLSG